MLRIFNFLPWRRRRDEEGLDRELRFHIERRIADLERSGLDAGGARRQAVLELGGLTRVKEDVRDTWVVFVEGILRELRHSLRLLGRSPAFSITAILTLALGIGATTAMFSVVHGVVIKPLPYPESENVVSVALSAVFGGTRGRGFPLAPRMFATYAENGRSFEEFGLWATGEAVVTGLGVPEHTNTLMATRGVLTTLGVQPVLGRWFSPGDDRPGAPETVILSNAYWQQQFGGDPKVLGEVLTIESRPHEVIGVMPAGFSFPLVSQPLPLILPFRFDPDQPPADYCCQGIARLKPAATLDQANGDVARMLEVWQREENRPQLESLQLRPALAPLKEDVVGDVGGVLWVLLGSIGLLLLIACANVANLLLVRAEGRGQELAIRTALGGGWRHLARTLMLDSLTLSVAGGLTGLGLAWAGLRFLVAYGPSDLPRLHELTIDFPVFAFAMTISILSGLLFGLIPVAKAAGPKHARQLHEFVHGAGRGASPGTRQRRSQNALVVVQVAFALVLVVSSGLMIRTFQNLRQVDPGFTDPETIQTVRITLTDTEVPEAGRVTRTQGEILDAIAAIPGVTAAAFVSQVPMSPFQSVNAIVAAEGNDYGAAGIPPTRNIKFMSPGYLETLGIGLVTGRDLTWEELYDQRNVALVSESFAKLEWNTIDGAIGKHILVGTGEAWQEVIGVVADVYDEGADQEPPPIVYWPARLQPFVAGTFLPRSVVFTIRSDRTGTERFVQDIREAVADVMPGLPVFGVDTLADVYNASMARTSFSLVLLGIAGAMALLLGIVGIYGVLSYAVIERQREVGIRLALGAAPSAVKGMFVYRGITLSGIGIVLGMAAAAGLTRLMSSLLFGVTPLDAATFASAAGVLVVAALTASYVPARRAAHVDPVKTLGGQ